MIEIKLALDEAGLLRSCSVQGHAGAGKRGTDVVCAAVSVLIRTALRVLADKPGLTVRGEAPARGSLWMEAAYTPEGRDFLSTTGLFLTQGLKSIAEDYPGFCKMNIYTERRN
ncbi:MAG: ribosomal-processing cysteine protease Prp [Treponema sp.]|nr:ribosomal-processing cysteine protease Prp [Treponema sp.]